MAATSAFLNVHDLAKSREFYEALGFRTTGASKDGRGRVAYVDLAYGAAELGLGAIGSNDDPEFRRWVSGELGAGVIVYVSVDDVDRVHAAARRIHAAIEAPLRDRSYGRAFNLNDPDGYVVCFLQEPKPRTRSRAAAAGPVPPKRGARRPARGREGKRRRATGARAP
jgi:catechol 2,3-dioxygenase-like lactoylglutathione lyase family enzyme